MADYIQALYGDLLEQFKDKPNIAAIMEAVGEQLQDVADFFEVLRTERTLNTAIGKQLDGAGDIVVLNRAEAGQMASIAHPGEPVTDEVYRKFLIYKVLKNTSICTYYDVMKSFQMFWDKPLYYSEDPEEPASMTFKTGTLAPGDSPEKILGAPIIRAAGVGVTVIATTDTPEMIRKLYITPIMGRGHMVTHMPEIEYYEEITHTLRVSAVVHSISLTRLPEIEPPKQMGVFTDKDGLMFFTSDGPLLVKKT